MSRMSFSPFNYYSRGGSRFWFRPSPFVTASVESERRTAADGYGCGIYPRNKKG